VYKDGNIFGTISSNIRGQIEKTQNRCLSRRRVERGDGMSVVLLSGRKNLTLWFGRYHLDIGLAMLLGSHKSRNSASCPHFGVVSIHLSLGAPRGEHHKKGNDPLGGSRSRMWMWLKDRRAKIEGLLHV
jgi:hypothetical protein